MIRNAQYSELNRAVMDQDRALDELMRNHKNTCQSNKREHRASLPAKKPRSIHSEYVPDDDMSLTLVKLRIQQEKAKRLQKQYEQEQLQLQMQQQHKQQRYAKRTEEKSNNNVIVIDVPSNTTLIIRSLPSSHQKPSIMKLSSSNKLVQLLKSFKPHKDTSYSNLTDTTTLVGDKHSKISSTRTSSMRSCSKHSCYGSDATTLDDGHYSSSSCSSSMNSKIYKEAPYYT